MLRARLILGSLALALACEQAPAAAPKSTSTPTPEGAAAAAAADPAPSRAEPDPAPTPPPSAAGIVYAERIVGAAGADDPLPMIVAIHGLGDTPDNFGHLFDTFTGPARLILVRGIDDAEGGGYSWFALRARDPDVAAFSEGVSAAADELAKAIDVLRNERPTEGLPIVTGFSQGGMLTFALATAHPEVVGAAFPVGGWLPPPLVPEKKNAAAPAIHAFHGTDDKAVAFEPTKIGVDSLDALGFDVQLSVYDGVGHAITPEIHRDLFDALTDAVAAAHASAKKASK